MTDVIEESRADQHKILAAMVKAINSRGDVRTSSLARRAGMDEKRAGAVMVRLVYRGLVESAYTGDYTMTAKGWQEAGVKPPLWVTL